MTTVFFPDNTVLINYTHVDRHDVVEWFLARTSGVGNWTASVARECEHSSRKDGLAKMKQWPGLFGKMLIANRQELNDAHTLASRMEKPGGTRPGQHMGEAETIAIARSRFMSDKVVFLTDDHDAARVAKSEGIQPLGTLTLIAYAEVYGIVTRAESQRCFDLWRNKKRRLLGPPGYHDYDNFVQGKLRSLGFS